MDQHNLTKVKKIIQELLKELTGQKPDYAITANQRLEQDLGLGSIERSELIHRVETTFDVRLDNQALAKISTVGDLVKLIEKAQPTFDQPVSTIETPKFEQNGKIDLSSCLTLNQLLTQLATDKPEAVHLRLLTDNQEQKLTYGLLYQQASIVATSLLQQQIQPGDTVAIMLPTELNFFYIFFGVLLAGAIPVPIYPPLRQDEIERYTNRQIKILQNAKAKVMVTFGRAQGLSQMVKPFVRELRFICTADELLKNKPERELATVDSEDIALIQYTSGSTGNPKGVVLTHHNLLSNIHTFGNAVKIEPDDVVVSWLPLYHDMGLIGMWLGTLYHQMPLVLMSPLNFLARPEQWLWAIHNYRGTISGGPNFGYEFCLNKIHDDTLQGLDLSCWRVAFNGAEAVYAHTLKHFTNKFAQFGFNHNAHFPVYGLAENSVGLTFPQNNDHPHVDYVQRPTLEKEHLARPADRDDKNTVRFIGCGQPLPDHEIRIADDNGYQLPERQVGEIEFKGPSSMQGYYRNGDATEKARDGEWWRTGDLGYWADNNLFVTGRKKDIIIKAGHNIYPEEIEAAAGTIDGVRKGCVAAFSTEDQKRQAERFVIVAEIKPQWQGHEQQISQNISQTIGQSCAALPDEVIPVPPHTVPKTSSGKLQRHACKQLYNQGKLFKKRRKFWQQLTKIATKSIYQRVKRAIGFMGRLIYGAYVGLLLLVTVPILWVSIMLCSTKTGRQLAKAWARGLLAVAFVRFRTEGLAHLKQNGIIVCNHNSYTDTLVLTAALPANMSFVAKQGLIRVPLLSSALKKLGHIVIPRRDSTQSLVKLEYLQKTLDNGHNVVIFPEGTFTQASGMKPFKLGAFKLAAETGYPVYPVTLLGTRELLTANHLLPSPNKVTIIINAGAYAQQNSWQGFTELRDHCFDLMLRQYGE